MTCSRFGGTAPPKWSTKCFRSSAHARARRLDAATWGTELAAGEGRGHIYIVEPTGEFEDDPNVTDKKFPGNPTRSYRTRDPVRVVGELADWVGHSPEKLQARRDRLAELRRTGNATIDD